MPRSSHQAIFASLLTLLLAISASSCSDDPAGAPDSGTPRTDAGSGEDGAAADSAPDTAGQDSSAPDTAIPNPGAVDYLIVAGDALAASAGRYRDFRVQSGYVVNLTLISTLSTGGALPADTVAAIKAHTRKYYDLRDQTRPFYLILLGDANHPIPVGSYHCSHQGLDIASDNTFADMDGDHIPDLAVGRIPAASDDEVDLVREKVMAYEDSYEVGPWNRRLNMFASTAGYGGEEDEMIHQAALEILNGISYDYDLSMTYASQDSEFVYVPEEFSDKVYERLNEGSLVTAYVGHGSPGSLSSLSWGGDYYSILDVNQMATKLHPQHKLPILLLIACSTGAFQENESLAERFLDQREGPVAVVGSTEESHPYGNAILAKEIADVATQRNLAPTVGAALMLAKERTIHQQDALRDLIEFFAALLYDTPTREALKTTHLHMYSLLGDPGTRLQAVRGTATMQLPAGTAAAGSPLLVSAVFDNLTSGSALFTLEASRRQILGTLQDVPPDGDPGRDQVIRSNYAMSNNKVVLQQEVAITSSAASTTLTIPGDIVPGLYYIKVYADNGTEDAFGHDSLQIGQ